MKVGIVGLGLIGGSMAKAFKRSADVTVLADNRNKTMLDFAMLSGAVDAPLTMENLKDCEILLLCSYPEAAEEYLKNAAEHIPADTLVMDCLGTKRKICEMAFPLAEKYGFTFVGGHPMAGTHNSGFKFSRADLFDGAPMVIVPPRYDEMELLERIKTLLEPVGFGSITVTTAEKHDEMIAFTSQMAHIVSNAYIKSPRAGSHKGFSAGSYRDLTRVAWLNPQMWTELFLENGDNLIKELDFLIERLGEYRTAIAENDPDTLIRILDEGRMRKKAIDEE
ncbi:MAG: prephenate dehydrogenase [Oscillospiraceae bacterium]|nr:prephenate dehydrogenase [Oscillospiraceae bacterium]